MSVSYLLVPKKLTHIDTITLKVPVPSPKSPAAAVQPPQTSVTPQPQNNGAAPELVVSSRGRKRKQTVSPPKIPAKVARVSTPGTTPKATSKKQQLAEKKTIASTKKQQLSNKKSVKNNNPSSKSSIAATDALGDANDPLNTSTGYHDLEDVETWVCGVCKCYDPIITTPVKNPKQAEAMMTTEWIGCDCNRWYHKYCTKLKKIDDSFSCVQLGIECLPLS